MRSDAKEWTDGTNAALEPSKHGTGGREVRRRQKREEEGSCQLSSDK